MKKLAVKKELDESQLKTLSFVTFLAGSLGVLGGVPQAITAFMGGVDDLNIITWMIWVITGLIMLTYNVTHKRTPLIIVSAGWVFMNSTILISIIYHRYMAVNIL